MAAVKKCADKLPILIRKLQVCQSKAYSVVNRKNEYVYKGDRKKARHEIYCDIELVVDALDELLDDLGEEMDR